MRASILIVNYNAGEKLRRCLESLLPSIPADAEIIVVDNASEDGSAGAAAEFPQVRLLRSERNLGFGGGNNLGAIEATGKYLVFLNPDTVVQAGWFEGLLRPFEESAEIGMTTAKILLTEPPHRVNTCGNVVHVTGLTLCRGLGEESEQFRHDEEVAAVSGAAFAMPAELFRELGGFDETFFLYMEDTDLSLRARLAGWRCFYTPASVVLHDYALRLSPQKVFLQERNRYLMLLKTLRWPTHLILLPAYLLAEIVTWGFVLKSDRSHFANKLKAYAWVPRHWRTIIASRRRTQRLRRGTDRELLAWTDSRLEYGQFGVGITTRLARLLFDPLFWLLRKTALALVRW